jgi:hypothetical protein
VRPAPPAGDARAARFAATADQLQRLAQELDFADATGAALDVFVQLAARGFGGDRRLHLAQAVERGEIQVAAVHERAQGLQPRFTGLDIAGHRARLQPRIALPVAAFALEVLVHRRERQRDAAGAAERAQAQVDAVAEAIDGGFVQQLGQALAEAGEILLGGQRARAVGFAALRVGVDQVDIGTEVELAAAGLPSRTPPAAGAPSPSRTTPWRWANSCCRASSASRRQSSARVVAPARVCATSSSPARSRQISRVDIAVRQRRNCAGQSLGCSGSSTGAGIGGQPGAASCQQRRLPHQGVQREVAGHRQPGQRLQLGRNRLGQDLGQARQGAVDKGLQGAGRSAGGESCADSRGSDPFAKAGALTQASWPRPDPESGCGGSNPEGEPRIHTGRQAIKKPACSELPRLHPLPTSGCRAIVRAAKALCTHTAKQLRWYG